MIGYAHSISAPRQPRLRRISALLALGLMAWAAVDLRAQEPLRDDKVSPKVEKLLRQQEQERQQQLLLLARQRHLAEKQPEQTVPHFQFTIDPQTPLKDLLPTAPKTGKARPVSSDDPARVPELQFQQAAPKDLPANQILHQTALTIARIKHINKKDKDAFIKALRDQRSDLAGLPFAMGDACRIQGEYSKQLTRSVNLVRRSMTDKGGDTGPGSIIDVPGEPSPAAAFWERYRVNCQEEEAGVHRIDRERLELMTRARIAALTQVLAPEAPSVRLGLVRYLAAVSHREATRALARLALFAQEEEVRLAALQALKVRRERDYTDILQAGLRYPWPAVAGRAADAIVKLERTDLIPDLVNVLDQPDPRAPVVRGTDAKKVYVANELVRLNHHRSCLLCHAPGNTEEVAHETLTAGVPLPSEPLGGLAGAYRKRIPDLAVRIDVTYLRQDFSLSLPVADAHPWPEMQRFDFLVRSRELTEEEVGVYREQFGTSDPSRPSAYQRAAVVALRHHGARRRSQRSGLAHAAGVAAEEGVVQPIVGTVAEWGSRAVPTRRTSGGALLAQADGTESTLREVIRI